MIQPTELSQQVADSAAMVKLGTFGSLLGAIIAYGSQFTVGEMTGVIVAVFSVLFQLAAFLRNRRLTRAQERSETAKAIFYERKLSSLHEGADSMWGNSR